MRTQAPCRADAAAPEGSRAEATATNTDCCPQLADAAVTAVHPIEMFTDGSCLRNPGPGGWAALLRAGTRERELTGAEPDTTNNRMELMAVIGGLEALTRPTPVIIYTVSQYVQKGAEEWLAGWRRRGWKTSAGAAVKNQDLWERLSTALQPHAARWTWVRGHAGHVENERVDQLARAAAETLRKP